MHCQGYAHSVGDAASVPIDPKRCRPHLTASDRSATADYGRPNRSQTMSAPPPAEPPISPPESWALTSLTGTITTFTPFLLFAIFFWNSSKTRDTLHSRNASEAFPLQAAQKVKKT